MARRCRLAVLCAVTAAALIAPAAPAQAEEYVVEDGDTLIGIAADAGVRLADLLRANRLTISSVIHPGDRLTLPGGSASPTGGSRTYTVRAGDSLYAIAHRHGVSLAALVRANDIRVTDVIHPGDRLTIPGPGTAPAAPRPPSPAAGRRTYTVRAGDSLYAIAHRHGVSLAALVSANDMAVTDLILPGMQLNLPAGARGAPATGSAPVERVVSYALAQVGKPWRFFSRGPHAFDCSGLTLAAYRQVGIRLVHHSASQANQGRRVDFPRESIRRGDLVFTNDDGGTVVNHVGIALGPTTWVHARAPGFGVQVNRMPSADVILAVRRFVPSR